MWGIQQRIIQLSKSRKESERGGSSLWVEKIEEIFYLLDRESRGRERIRRGRDFISLPTTSTFDRVRDGNGRCTATYVIDKERDCRKKDRCVERAHFGLICAYAKFITTATRH